jgi:predicted O-methyltransferase YrrM
MAKKSIKQLNHEGTIQTVCLAVKNYADAFNAFQNDPSGENYKLVESARNLMFSTSNVAYEVTFLDSASSRTKEALLIGLRALEYKEKQEALKAV